MCLASFWKKRTVSCRFFLLPMRHAIYVKIHKTCVNKQAGFQDYLYYILFTYSKWWYSRGLSLDGMQHAVHIRRNNSVFLIISLQHQLWFSLKMVFWHVSVPPEWYVWWKNYSAKWTIIYLNIDRNLGKKRLDSFLHQYYQRMLWTLNQTWTSYCSLVFVSILFLWRCDPTQQPQLPS